IATYPDGAESYASLEACDALKKDIPVITNVSNDSINFAVGNVFIAWSKPIDLDTIQYPGPYNYQVYRSDGFYGSNLNLIAYKPGLNDTLYFDDQVNLNTSGIPYSYRINLVSETIGDIGFTQIASSIFLSIYETDNELQLSWEMNAPWTNNYFVVYRRDPGQIKFDSIGWSNTNFYSDSGLINGQKYCYYIESIGKYTSPGFVEPIINYSQIKCGIPYDNVPPCPPVLSVTTICDLIENELTWYNPNNTCADDVAKYYIYYSPFEYGDLILIDSTNHPDVMVYIHSNLTSITACYAVTAIDSVGNESEFSNVVCVDYDDCPLYELPNIFTPNSDNYNDYFVPFPERVAAVEKIDLTIFNRWGRIVFKTDDPKINWDGKNQKNNKDCSQGVYFYVCDVYEITLEGLRKRIIRGSVSIYR
ncbi:MAG: gliding motility-associated C-terminal domain-containing protein, partial [Bacteroidetes bacterium]|nr:gliding motility-associated C-terminal domain-containing protein [Bacteroidota bacterium]